MLKQTVDTTAPSFTTSLDVTVNVVPFCTGTALLVMVDDDVTVSYADTVASAETTLYARFDATDDNSNSATYTQTITVVMLQHIVCHQ